MPKRTLNELTQSIGTRTGDFLVDTANSAANFVCGLYKDFPGAVVPNPIDSFNRGLWDSLCRNRPSGLPAPPAVPPVPFTGGQCVNVSYRVKVVNKSGFNPDNPSNYQLHDLRGPITGLTIISTGGGAQTYKVGSNGVVSTANGYDDTATVSTTLAPYIHSVTRLDGLADNCGNVYTGPPSYPTTTIPNNRKSTNTTVTYNDGGTVSIPLVYAPVSGELTVNVNVGGVTFKFDQDGVSTDTTGLEKAVKDLQTGITETKDLVKQPVKPPSSGGLTETTNAEDSAQEKKGISKLKWVSIQLTTVPTNAKSQYGDKAQNVVYAGWFQFIVDNSYLPRHPIHFGRSMFAAPSGANGYAYTLYEGFKGIVKEYKE